jgi:hypothetical protein
VDALDVKWTYGVSWAPEDIPDWTHLMLSLLDGEQPQDNGDASTRWSRAPATTWTGADVSHLTAATIRVPEGRSVDW